MNKNVDILLDKIKKIKVPLKIKERAFDLINILASESEDLLPDNIIGQKKTVRFEWIFDFIKDDETKFSIEIGKDNKLELEEVFVYYNLKEALKDE